MGFIDMSWLNGCGLFITSHERQDVDDKMEKLYIQNIPISLFPFVTIWLLFSNQLQELHDLNPRIIKRHKLHLYTNILTLTQNWLNQ
jgi:hypothetical protein